ncbi:hypothetical protein BDU57DRAFT_523003 [Ampelomyces quisqualis]|uniref:Uncharacterized protein n=1 Tax=Ampelomyces quisqualis TaxID=50730 RepID=A0A6A5QB76_AMPQU|nr:hypothetical protein BDU57DRAFT_523003 [Ampelomyces quisqualis]
MQAVLQATTMNPFPTTGSIGNPFAPSRISSTATPTSFSLTTYSTSHASSSFTRPTAIPSVFSFGPASSCTSNSVSQATPFPSPFPRDTPSGSSREACVISNDADVNDHAFWDLYACCKGMDMTAIGEPNLCSAQCSVGPGQSVLDLGECLSKRVDVVVCRVGASGDGMAGGSPSQSAGQSGSRTSGASTGASASGSQSGSASGSASVSTGIGNAVGVVHVGGGKMGVVVFSMLAVGSFVWMLL